MIGAKAQPSGRPSRGAGPGVPAQTCLAAPQRVMHGGSVRSDLHVPIPAVARQRSAVVEVQVGDKREVALIVEVG